MKTFLSLLILFLLISGNVEAKSPRIGEAAPGLSLTAISGRQVDTARLKGSTVVIYFWNDRCNCVEQLVQLRNFVNARQNRPGAFPFVFLTVNEGQSKEVAEGFIRKHGLPYEVLLDTDLKAGKGNFGVKVLPTVFVIDRWGILREKVIGVVESKKLVEIISRYL